MGDSPVGLLLAGRKETVVYTISDLGESGCNRLVKSLVVTYFMDERLRALVWFAS